MAASGTPKNDNTTAANTSVAGIYEKLFPPVHIMDGPCVKTAPFHHKFVEPDDRAEYSVTCPACKVYMVLQDNTEEYRGGRYQRKP